MFQAPRLGDHSCRIFGEAPSKFLVVDTRRMKAVRTIVLHGTFTFDALSPNASKMYLIQYASVGDLSHYIVRAYDMRVGRRFQSGGVRLSRGVGAVRHGVRMSGGQAHLSERAGMSLERPRRRTTRA